MWPTFSGAKVKPILQKSLLHVGLLGQIWELSDVDRDGHLDMEEFSLAMYLLNKSVNCCFIPINIQQVF